MRPLTIVLTPLVATLLVGSLSAGEGDAQERGANRAQFRQEMVNQFDADGDGKLNEEERDRARAKRGKRAKQGNRGERGGRARGGPGGPPDPDQVFERFDENGDNQLSREEFMKLTEEMRAMREQRGMQRGDRSQGKARRGKGRKRSRDQQGDFGRRPPLQNPGDFPGPPRDGRRGFRGPEDGPQGRQGRRPDGFRPPDPNDVFDRFDENGDDQLSRDEFMDLVSKMRATRERMKGHGRDRDFRPGPPGDSPRGRGPDRPPRPDFNDAEPGF